MPFEDNMIAYGAALFEGEGTIQVNRYHYANDGIKKVRETPQVKIRINMTDLEPLQCMLDNFGGRINGPYKYKYNKKQFWVWDLDSPRIVANFLDAIADYLSPRRLEQIEAAYAI